MFVFVEKSGTNVQFGRPIRRRQKIWRLTLQIGLSRLRIGQYSIRNCGTQLSNSVLKAQRGELQRIPCARQKNKQGSEVRASLIPNFGT